MVWAMKPKSQVGPLRTNLKRLRAAAELTQEQLAEKAGLARVTVAFIESGRTKDADGATLNKLARALNVDVSELLRVEGDVDTAYVETDVDTAYVETFLASPWGQVTKPTDDELEWLRGISARSWVGIDPVPEAVHHLIQARRTSKKTTA